MSLTGLGAGELSAVFLARELSADLVLLDELKARRYAQRESLPVIGCIGILEHLYQKGELKDLREAYQELIQHKTRIDLRTLQSSLAMFNLPPL
jgi:predicted nucleic acid-binding protein